MRRILALAVWIIAIAQAVTLARFLRLLVKTYSGRRIPRAIQSTPGSQTSVVVPVLNELARLERCLEPLIRQGSSVSEILVVDGGSTDGTQDLVHLYSRNDPRVRLVDAVPVPADWNGKAWGLETGLRASDPDADWLVTIDADVKCGIDAVARVVGFAQDSGVPFLSVACQQVANGVGISLVHPSMLSTLVYRFGIPGQIAQSVNEVQANGQFALFDRTALLTAGGFSIAKDSICEDVTIARHLFLCGFDVGFYEGDGLAETEMYTSARECLSNWPRSLGLSDRFLPNAWREGLANLVLLQVLPLLVLIWRPEFVKANRVIMTLNRVLLGTRLGIMIGTRRAYSRASWSYALSPVADPVTLASYLLALVRSKHSWRGRDLIVWDGKR